MAGFDFDVDVPRSGKLLARALLRELQVLARRRTVRVDFRSNARGFYVAVNGSLFEIQALVEASRPFLAGLSIGS